MGVPITNPAFRKQRESLKKGEGASISMKPLPEEKMMRRLKNAIKAARWRGRVC